MKITIVGTGYVGLVSGTCFAETGNNVVCVDINKSKVEKMQNGIIPIYEPGLEVIFQRNIEQGRLRFTTDLKSGVEHGDIIFLALPTPPGEDGSADLSYILNVAKQLASLIKRYTIIVDKSTVPVGTAEKVHSVLKENGLDPELFDVVSNPEFLREGAAVDDFMKPDRVVIGAESEKALQQMKALYEPFVRQGNPIIMMDTKSAEMTKYAANSFLATKISFMNEVANLCELVGADVDKVRAGVGTDQRIGKRFLFPGVGYGGSCFPKDVQALARTSEENNYTFSILNSVMDVNRKQKLRVFDKMMNYFDGNMEGLTVGLWGLAFKPNTDDIREAPALYTIDKLLDAGVTVKVFDPEAMDNVKDIYGDKLVYSHDQYDLLEGVDALGIITEWNVFRTPDFNFMKQKMRKPVIIDGRNLFDYKLMKEKGFYYESIGRPVLK